MTVDARGGIILPATIQGNTINKHMMLIGVGTVEVNPDMINSGNAATTSVTITGVKTGDLIFMQPPDTLEKQLHFVGAAVLSADTVGVTLLCDTNAINTNGAARDWSYILVSKTEP